MKLYKLMTINDIAIHIDEGSRAKDLSRVRMRICENGLPSIHTDMQILLTQPSPMHKLTVTSCIGIKALVFVTMVRGL